MPGKGGRPVTNGSGLGKSALIECPECGNTARKGAKALREAGPDLCGFCYDAGAIVRMRCADPRWEEVTPQGRKAAIAEAEAVAGRTLEIEHEKIKRTAYPQLRCDGCNTIQTKARSVELIEAWQRVEGVAWNDDSLMVRPPDWDSWGAVGLPLDFHPGCECGCDRFVRQRKGGRLKAREVIPF